MYPWQVRLNECIGEDPYEVWTLADRMNVLAKASSSLAEAGKFLMRCKTDRVFFTNSGVDTFNPRLKKTSRDIPFFLELRQAEYLCHLDWCVTEGIDRVCLKTRYVGASWLEMAYDAHEWLFNPGYVSLVGSRTQELVDGTGDSRKDSLFAKFDHIIARLPPILKPVGYSPTNPNKVKLLRNNPATEAQMTGEPVTEDFGSGPRATRVLIDELSKCQNKEAAWEACGQTTDSRSAIFTPKGKDFAWGLAFPDEYKEITGKAQVGRPQVFRIHWKDIPRFNKFYCLTDAQNEQWLLFRADLNLRSPQATEQFLLDLTGSSYSGYAPLDEIPMGMCYDDGNGNITRLRERQPLDEMPIGTLHVVYPWYERERLKYDEAGVAQELDINFDKSVSRKVYSIQLAFSILKGYIDRDPSLPLYIGLDPGRSAGNAAFLIWAQFNYATGRYEFIREYTNEGRDAYFYVPLVTGMESHYKYLDRSQPSDKDIAFFEESQDPAWFPDMCYGDPFIDNKGASNDSWKSVFTEKGIPIRCSHEQKSPWDRVQALRAVLQYSDFSKAGAPRFRTALQEIYLPPPSNSNSVVTTVQFAYVHHPIYSHACAAGEYLAVHDPHRKDRGIIDNDEESDETGRDTGRRSERSVREPDKRVPAGYVYANGIAVPRSAAGAGGGYRSRTSGIVRGYDGGERGKAGY